MKGIATESGEVATAAASAVFEILRHFGPASAQPTYAKMPLRALSGFKQFGVSREGGIGTLDLDRGTGPRCG